MATPKPEDDKPKPYEKYVAAEDLPGLKTADNAGERVYRGPSGTCYLLTTGERKPFTSEEQEFYEKQVVGRQTRVGKPWTPSQLEPK
jgi:hypothetical protein